MHFISKVQGGRSGWKIDHMTIAGKHVNPVFQHILTQRIGKLTQVTDIIVPIQYLSQPSDFFFIRFAANIGVSPLVFVMGADTIFSFIMHLVRSDLHFNNFALWPDHCGMQRAITVRLWRCDIIIKLMRDTFKSTVHETQGRIAITHRIHQDTNRPNIINLREIDLFTLHFSPN